MYCIKCGNEIPDGSTICPNCNETIIQKASIDDEIINRNVEPEANNTNTVKSNHKNYDTSTRGMAATGFFLPPVGLIFYFLSKKDTPVRAKTALEGAIFGLCTYGLAAVIFIFLILPVEKKLTMKYLCETNIPGSIYSFENYTCTHPDGSTQQLLMK